MALLLLSTSLTAIEMQSSSSWTLSDIPLYGTFLSLFSVLLTSVANVLKERLLKFRRSEALFQQISWLAL